jgi:hypothetical protein
MCTQNMSQWCKASTPHQQRLNGAKQVLRTKTASQWCKAKVLRTDSVSMVQSKYSAPTASQWCKASTPHQQRLNGAAWIVCKHSLKYMRTVSIKKSHRSKPSWQDEKGKGEMKEARGKGKGKGKGKERVKRYL